MRRPADTPTSVTKRTLIIMGAAALPVVFVVGVWVGGAADTGAQVTSTSGTRVSTSTTAFQTVTSTNTADPTRPTQSPTTSSTGSVAPLPTGWVRAEVVEVVDGDTIDVRFGNGSVERVRLIGTNSPEGGECYAEEAMAGLTALVLGEDVLLEPDTSDRDQFGRLLRYVWTTDDRLVNEITVEEGWAIAREYPPDTARADQLETAQLHAMEEDVGLWAPDACGASNPADVQITHIEYDAPGDDNFNLNGEWAEVTNADDVPVDLTSWTLKDESASHRYVFPNGFILQPEETVRVFTGCGQDTLRQLYWCNSGSAVWNNSGDTGFLVNPEGNIVHSYAYG